MPDSLFTNQQEKYLENKFVQKDNCIKDAKILEDRIHEIETKAENTHVNLEYIKKQNTLIIGVIVPTALGVLFSFYGG